MKNGYSAELARRRIALGCNWMSLPGLEYTMNDLIKVNFAKVFEAAFSEYTGEDTRELYQRFLTHLRIALDCIAEGIDFHLNHQYRNAPELLLNLVCHGPIERGRDASHGGVDYYNIGVDGSGGSDADMWAQRISRDFSQMVATNRTPQGVLMIPGLFSWANTIPLGKAVGATPNGRLSGTPIKMAQSSESDWRYDTSFC